MCVAWPYLGIIPDALSFFCSSFEFLSRAMIFLTEVIDLSRSCELHILSRLVHILFHMAPDSLGTWQNMSGEFIWQQRTVHVRNRKLAQECMRFVTQDSCFVDDGHSV